MKIRILIISLTILIQCFPAHAERGINIKPKAQARTALVIGNSEYKSSPLKNPANDASDMASALRDSGFDVTLKVNATQREMKKSIKEFGGKLKKGGVGMFYYAGHGLQMDGRNYLVPIGATIDTESEVEYEAVDAGRILGQMEDAGNDLNIVILDACRNNPFARSFRSANKGLAKMDAPTGSFIAYATAPGSVAADGDGRNGLYTQYLLKHMKEPNLSVEKLFKKVRVAVVNDTAKKQTPWESSSLVGDFYFNTEGGDVIVSIPAPPNKTDQQDPEQEMWMMVKNSKTLKEVQMFLDSYPKGQYINHAKLRLVQLKKQNELSGQKYTMLERPTKEDTYEKPSPSNIKMGSKEKKRSIRFVSKNDGTVLDTKTGLMWASEDNGNGVNWRTAKNYCKKYSGGGYKDWRMPAQNELADLYSSKSSSKATQESYNVHITKLISLSTSTFWSSDKWRGSEALYYSFRRRPPVLGLARAKTSSHYNVLPVRNAR